MLGSIRTTAPLTAALKLMLEAVEFTEIVPVLDVIEAPEFVIAPEPEIVMSPLAESAPVGATEVPPDIESVPPFAAIAPAPE